jgi:hypothetical protein
MSARTDVSRPAFLLSDRAFADALYVTLAFAEASAVTVFDQGWTLCCR